MSKAKELANWYEDCVEEYMEAVQMHVMDLWQDKYGDEKWVEFHELDKTVKLKFYVEGKNETRGY